MKAFQVLFLFGLLGLTLAYLSYIYQNIFHVPDSRPSKESNATRNNASNIANVSDSKSSVKPVPNETTKRPNLPTAIKFNAFEQKYVDTINSQLAIPFEFNTEENWDDRVQRYVFYSVVFSSAMPKPIANRRPLPSLAKNESAILSINFFAKMALSVRNTLRLTAKEAEYFIKRTGELKVASGALVLAGSILGLIGLILAPVGGVALSATAISVITASSIATEIVGTGVDFASDMINPTEESFEKMAKSQMEMFEKQGKFLNTLLEESIVALDKSSRNMSKSELKDAEKYLYLYDMAENMDFNNATKQIFKHILRRYGGWRAFNTLRGTINYDGIDPVYLKSAENFITMPFVLKKIYKHVSYVDLMTRDYPKFVAALEGKTLFEGKPIASILVSDTSGKMSTLAAKLFKDDIDTMMKKIARFCVGCSKKAIYRQAALKVFTHYGFHTYDLDTLKTEFELKFRKVAEEVTDPSWKAFNKYFVDDLDKRPPMNKGRLSPRLKKELKKFISKMPQESGNIFGEMHSKVKDLKTRAIQKLVPNKFRTWMRANEKIVKKTFRSLGRTMHGISIGFAIYDIATGVFKIQGSGTVTDRLNEQADMIDVSLLGTISIYESITGLSLEKMFDDDQLSNTNILTGMELLSCDKFFAGTSSGIKASIKVDHANECTTKDLAKHKSLDMNEWRAYSGSVLGNCTHFPLPILDKEAKVELSLGNGGKDSACIENVNLKMNFEPAARMTCEPDQLTWIASDYDEQYSSGWMTYTSKMTAQCKTISGISQLTTYVPDKDHAGSKSPIKFGFKLKNSKTCLTEVLDKAGRDFARGSKSVYRSRNLGECFDLDIKTEDLMNDNHRGRYIEVIANNYGTDGITFIAIEFYANVGTESERFKCNLPPAGIRLDNNGTSVKCYLTKDTFEVRSLEAIKIIPRKRIASATLHICSYEMCCQTSYSYNFDQPVLLEKQLLRDCEGFQIKNNTYHIWVHDESGIGVSDLRAVSLYSSRFKMITPMSICFAKNFWRCKVRANISRFSHIEIENRF